MPYRRPRPVRGRAAEVLSKPIALAKPVPSPQNSPTILYLAAALLTLLLLALAAHLSSVHSAKSSGATRSLQTTSYLVRGASLDVARDAVEAVGGEITHDLGIIRAVAANLTSGQHATLSRRADLRLFDNAPVQASTVPAPEHVDHTEDDCEENGDDEECQPNPYTEYTQLVRADVLHRRGLTGHGVTVAILDSGLWDTPSLKFDTRGRKRRLAFYDAIRDERRYPRDAYGHGTHVASIIADHSVAVASDGRRRFNGMAPDVELVAVRAFNRRGQGTYADVIRGLDWLLLHHQTFGIRILNLSFGAQPKSHYWDDPLNQAVLELWRAGIAVVVAAGNQGPDPMTITVPGNLPYVITVGAMSDAFTPGNRRDDYLATFSSAGPTAEGFVKPDLVAPGAHMLGKISPGSTLTNRLPERLRGGYFELSGTSQAAAVVAGAAALALQAQPWLTPDQLKCRLMASAHAAVHRDDSLAYSPFQQGAGMIDAVRVLKSRTKDCANRGLDIHEDIARISHFSGPARFDEQLGFYIPGTDYTWSGKFNKSTQAPFVGGSPWLYSDPWIDGQSDPWIDGQSDPWIEGQSDPWIEGQHWLESNPWIESTGDPWIDSAGAPWITTLNWDDPEWSLSETLGVDHVDLWE